MNAKIIRNFSIAAGLALLAGCAQQGTIMGRLEVPGEKATTPVTMNWNTPGFSGGGTMSVHLPAGETYTGKYLQITSATSANTLGGGGYMGGWGGGWGGASSGASGNGLPRRVDPMLRASAALRWHWMRRRSGDSPQPSCR